MLPLVVSGPRQTAVNLIDGQRAAGAVRGAASRGGADGGAVDGGRRLSVHWGRPLAGQVSKQPGVVVGGTRGRNITFTGGAEARHARQRVAPLAASTEFGTCWVTRKNFSIKKMMLGWWYNVCDLDKCDVSSRNFYVFIDMFLCTLDRCG